MVEPPQRSNAHTGAKAIGVTEALGIKESEMRSKECIGVPEPILILLHVRLNLKGRRRMHMV